MKLQTTGFLKLLWVYLGKEKLLKDLIGSQVSKAEKVKMRIGRCH
jgi:hypothetical protein